MLLCHSQRNRIAQLHCVCCTHWCVSVCSLLPAAASCFSGTHMYNMIYINVQIYFLIFFFNSLELLIPIGPCCQSVTGEKPCPFSHIHNVHSFSFFKPQYTDKRKTCVCFIHGEGSRREGKAQISESGRRKRLVSKQPCPHQKRSEFGSSKFLPQMKGAN